MKHLTIALIATLGLIAPGLAFAANTANAGDSIYERDLATWNGSTENVNTVRFELDTIHARDLAVWNGAGQYVKPLQLQYDRIYQNDLEIANGAGKKANSVNVAYDAIYERALSATINTARFEYNGIQYDSLWSLEAVTAFA